MQRAGFDSAKLPSLPKEASYPTVAPALVAIDDVILGHALDVIRKLPKESVQAVVTSPPFWGQRVYLDEKPVAWSDGTTVAFGRESKPEAYVTHSLEILRGLLPVLKKSGTIWWNIGDSYMTRTILRGSSADRIRHYGGQRSTWADNPDRRISYGHPLYKDKDLALIPFLVARGAQELGYWVRSVIIWSKQRTSDQADGATQVKPSTRAHMPEPVLDRPVTGHEYVLLLSRDVQYDYYPLGEEPRSADTTAVNVRTVWMFPPVSAGSQHGARFPEELPRRCIQLATSAGDLVFDPFAGEGTTLVAAKALGRHYLGCDISPTYVELAKALLNQDGPEQGELITRS